MPWQTMQSLPLAAYRFLTTHGFLLKDRDVVLRRFSGLVLASWLEGSAREKPLGLM